VVHAPLQSSPPARLAFCERSTLPGAVDGAWWPSRSDLRSELPDLIAVIGTMIGPIRRVVYDPSVWPEAPSRIIRGSAVISVDPYTLVAPDTIYLIGTHARDAVLYIVPPSVSAAAVRRILDLVSDPDRKMSAAVLRNLVEDFSSRPSRFSDASGQ